METVWTHGFREIKCDVSERPVILSEPAYSITSQRERTVRLQCAPAELPRFFHLHFWVNRWFLFLAQAEIMFETFGVPALFLARQPLLAALSVGRASAIVVDIGYTATRVAPVYDGYVIQSECVRYTGSAGAALIRTCIFSVCAYVKTAGFVAVLLLCCYFTGMK